MKKNLLPFFFIILGGFIFFSLGFFMGTNYKSKLDLKEVCGVSKNVFTVKVKKNSLEPNLINAKRCDKLTFYNADDIMHGITFGEHDRHEPYGEFAQEYLQPKERITLKLFKSGSYLFHDHLFEELKGKINISN